MSDARNVVVVTPPPTPNGPLHLGHLSGPYVAGDVAARAASGQGARVVRICGLDSNQNYVPVRARQLGTTADKTLKLYGQEIRLALSRARVTYDAFIDPPAQPGYRQAVVDLLAELIESKAVVVDDAELAVCDRCDRTMHHAYASGRCPGCGAAMGGGTCEGCARFASAGMLLEPICALCGGAPRVTRAPIPVLRLEEYRERLCRFWSQTALPSQAIALIRHYLTTSLPDVPLAYPTDWGIGLPDRPGERLDVWAEMGLGYVYSIANAGRSRGAAAYPDAWREIDETWFFCGVDNTFYYAIMFPALFAAAGLPLDAVRGLVVNEFYRLDGAKFSTSRDHAIWANDFLTRQDPALVRLFLCWDRPDCHESDFSLRAFKSFAARAGRALAARRTRSRPGNGGTARLRAALELPTFDPATAVRCVLEDVEAARPYIAPLIGIDQGTG